MNAPLKKAIENSLARRGITNMNYGAPVVEGKAERMLLPLPPSRTTPVPVSVAATILPPAYDWSKVVHEARAMGGLTASLEADKAATVKPN